MKETDYIIILYCSDQYSSTEFYSKLLEKEPVLNVPGMTEFQIGENVLLGLMPESGIDKILNGKTPHPSSGNGIPRCEIYFYTEDIDNTMAKASALGANLISEKTIRDWGDTAAYFTDLDGHVIGIASKKENNNYEK